MKKRLMSSLPHHVPWKMASSRLIRIDSNGRLGICANTLVRVGQPIIFPWWWWTSSLVAILWRVVQAVMSHENLSFCGIEFDYYMNLYYLEWLVSSTLAACWFVSHNLAIVNVNDFSFLYALSLLQKSSLLVPRHLYLYQRGRCVCMCLMHAKIISIFHARVLVSRD